jgi:hypothetical protein
MNLLCVTVRPAPGAETLLLMPVTTVMASAEGDELPPTGRPGVGALAVSGWRLGRVLGRRREPHSAEV